ncbi:PQQ-dependent sugar dehydrogenase [Henriciella litoralis]|uniref:PQQ-dependent sugar dehydrogenase n=1 Tax=Henriciella litoralis TaxID=568102 RepID=UPI000A012D05|nr:PQQ-dependent sugar dehydrogenase [Henriciella litoralis]
MRHAIALASLLALTVACSGATDEPAADKSNGSQAADTQDAAAETAENVLVSKDGFQLTPVAEGLDFPWDMIFLPSGDMLVTERGGQIRIIRDGQLLPSPVAGTPDTLVNGQGGYFGMALDPDFASNRRLYLSFAKGTPEQNTTTVISGTLSEDASQLTEVQEIFSGTPRETSHHFGGRLVFIDDGTLIVSMGEGFRYMDEAQNPMNYHGTIARINSDGSTPEDNPFADGSDGAPAVWTYGHRNVQGLVWDEARGILWAHEHGPKGGDELNIIEPGNNYGWPAITYGVNYDGTIITEETSAPGMEQPVTKWVPSIAPSGMALVSGDEFSDWSGDLLIGAMNGPKGQKIVHVDLDEAGQVLGTTDLMADLKIPFRDVAMGPDGELFVATANADGVIYRVTKQ